ncbi:MAG: hypothetical protein WA001_04640 [Patescibacteria group bacterium]
MESNFYDEVHRFLTAQGLITVESDERPDRVSMTREEYVYFQGRGEGMAPFSDDGGCQMAPAGLFMALSSMLGFMIPLNAKNYEELIGRKVPSRLFLDYPRSGLRFIAEAGKLSAEKLEPAMPVVKDNIPLSLPEAYDLVRAFLQSKGLLEICDEPLREDPPPYGGMMIFGVSDGEEYWKQNYDVSLLRTLMSMVVHTEFVGRRCEGLGIGKPRLWHDDYEVTGHRFIANRGRLDAVPLVVVHKKTVKELFGPE